MSQDFLLGFTACGCFAIALFFLRFWRASGDRFFVLMGTAFGIFAFNRLALAILEEESETRPFIYLFRLLAFLMILVAILEKNRQDQ